MQRGGIPAVEHEISAAASSLVSRWTRRPSTPPPTTTKLDIKDAHGGAAATWPATPPPRGWGITQQASSWHRKAQRRLSSPSPGRLRRKRDRGKTIARTERNTGAEPLVDALEGNSLMERPTISAIFALHEHGSGATALQGAPCSPFLSLLSMMTASSLPPSPPLLFSHRYDKTLSSLPLPPPPRFSTVRHIVRSARPRLPSACSREA